MPTSLLRQLLEQAGPERSCGWLARCAEAITANTTCEADEGAAQLVVSKSSSQNMKRFNLFFVPLLCAYSLFDRRPACAALWCVSQMVCSSAGISQTAVLGGGGGGGPSGAAVCRGLPAGVSRRARRAVTCEWGAPPV